MLDFLKATGIQPFIFIVVLFWLQEYFAFLFGFALVTVMWTIIRLGLPTEGC